VTLSLLGKHADEGNFWPDLAIFGEVSFFNAAKLELFAFGTRGQFKTYFSDSLCLKVVICRHGVTGMHLSLLSIPRMTLQSLWL
jgi:hypothetical protein